MSLPTALDADALLAHAGFVRAMARGVLGADDRVEDVVQDTWVAALSRERPPSRLRSWLASVGRRRAADVRRKDAVRSRHEHASVRPTAAPATDLLVERAEVTRRLIDALLSLDEPYRETLLLRYWEDLPPREIAARTATPVETAKTRLQRGHARLRELLDERHGGDRRAWAVALAGWAGVEASTATAGAASSATAGMASPTAAAPVGAVVRGTLVLALGAMAVIAAVVIVVRQSRNGDDMPVVSDRPVARGDDVEPAMGSASLAAAPFSPAMGGADAPLSGANADAPAAPSPAGGIAAKTLAVKGTVKDRDGKPVVGIPVRYSLTPADPKTAHPVPSESYTDAEGRYVVDGLVAGKLWMSLLSEAGFEPSPERTIDPEAEPTQDFTVAGHLVLAGELAVPSRAPVEVWLDYREAQAGGVWFNVGSVRKATLAPGTRAFRFTALRPGTHELHVETSGAAKFEEAIDLFADRSDVRVALAPSERASGHVVLVPPLGRKDTSAWVRSLDGSRQEMLELGADGTFALEGLPEGRYVLLARNTTVLGEGERARTIETERAKEFALPLASGGVEIELRRDEEVGLVLRAPAGTDAVRGSVRVLGGPDWPDAAQRFTAQRRGDRMEIRSAQMVFVSPPLRETRDDGAFLVRGVVAGRVTVRVETVGFAPAEREVTVDGPTTVEVELLPESGRLVRTEIPSEYWTVEARKAVGGEWKRILWRDARVHITHRETPGESRASIEPGEWEFRAVSTGFAPAHLGPLAVERSSEPLTLAFPLAKASTLRGTLSSAEGLPSRLLLHLFLREEGGTFRRLEEKTTNVSDGAFAVEGLAPGHYRVSPSDEGKPVVAEVDLVGSEATVEIRMPK